MKFYRVGSWCLCLCVWYCSAAPPRSPAAGSEWPLDIRPDGSYRYAYSTGDSGRHYHTATASPDNTVTGVFGYKDPKTGRDLQTKYSAGKRGFRANGPHIARRMDLSQNKIPYHPPVSPDSSQYNPTYSTYHDPNEDPTYSFEFNTPTHSRKEDSDYKGDVNGRYSYIDDVGLRHVVDYEAGSKIGFHVKSAYPDSNPIGSGIFFAGPPANRKSSKPLRGHTAIQRGKDGSYSFTAVGPDQRRTEESDATGNVKGFYTYFDDKGVQRTTQYIAGPNIGYKIVSSHTNNRYPVIPYPPSYPSFLPPPSEDKDGDIFGTGPDISGIGGKPPVVSGQKPQGGGSKDPWADLAPSLGSTGTTSTTTTPLPGSSTSGGFGDDLFGPETGGGPTGNDNDEDYPNGHGYEYGVPGKDDGSFILPQPSTPISNIPYGNCCKLVPTRPSPAIKSSSRPSRNNEQFVGFPSGVPIRAHVQSLDIKTYRSRLPAPGAAIDLPVPPKSRRGAESDEPDYWGFKVRRHSQVEDQEGTQDILNIQTSSRPARHSVHENAGVEQTEESQDIVNIQTSSRSARHSAHGNTRAEQPEKNQDILKTHITSHSAKHKDVQGNARAGQPVENQHTDNLETSLDSEDYRNIGTGDLEENQDTHYTQTPSHSENYRNAEAGEPGVNQDTHYSQTSSKSDNYRNAGAGEPEENQDTHYSQRPSHSENYRNAEVGEPEKNQDTLYSQTPLHSVNYRSAGAGLPEENQDTHYSQIPSHSENYRKAGAGLPEENQDTHYSQIPSHSVNYRNTGIGEPGKNQDTLNSQTPLHSENYRNAGEEQPEENQDTHYSQTPSLSENYRSAGAGKPEEKQDTHYSQTPIRSENFRNEGAEKPTETEDILKLQPSLHSEVHSNAGVEQVGKTQEYKLQIFPSNSEVHGKANIGQLEATQDILNHQTFSRSARHLKVYGNLDARQEGETQNIANLPPFSNSEVDQNSRTSEPDGTVTQNLQTSSEQTRYSQVHRQSTERQIEENKDLQLKTEQRQRLGLSN